MPDPRLELLKAQALRLLDRRPPFGAVLADGVYRPDSLPGLLGRLADPAEPLDGAALVSLCLQFAQAYVQPDSLGEVVSLDAATELAGRFVLRRHGTPLLEGQDALRLFLLHHGFALQMLFDLAKTAHLLAVLTADPPPARDRPFVGLDCGTGTGILLLGQYLLARRGGWRRWNLTGFERVPQVAARADLVLSRLGVGRVVLADATRPETFAPFVGPPVDCLANETLPSAGRRLYKEPFPRISRAVFEALGPAALAGTRFLPEAVWASDREGRAVTRLGPDNAFAGDALPGAGGRPLHLLYMRDLGLCGLRLPVERVGERYVSLVAPAWRAVLGRRW